MKEKTILRAIRSHTIAPQIGFQIEIPVELKGKVSIQLNEVRDPVHYQSKYLMVRWDKENKRRWEWDEGKEGRGGGGQYKM